MHGGSARTPNAPSSLSLSFANLLSLRTSFIVLFGFFLERSKKFHSFFYNNAFGRTRLRTCGTTHVEHGYVRISPVTCAVSRACRAPELATRRAEVRRVCARPKPPGASAVVAPRLALGCFPLSSAYFRFRQVTVLHQPAVFIAVTQLSHCFLRCGSLHFIIFKRQSERAPPPPLPSRTHTRRACYRVSYLEDIELKAGAHRKRGTTHRRRGPRSSLGGVL